MTWDWSPGPDITSKDKKLITKAVNLFWEKRNNLGGRRVGSAFGVGHDDPPARRLNFNE